MSAGGGRKRPPSPRGPSATPPAAPQVHLRVNTKTGYPFRALPVGTDSNESEYPCRALPIRTLVDGFRFRALPVRIGMTLSRAIHSIYRHTRNLSPVSPSHPSPLSLPSHSPFAHSFFITTGSASEPRSGRIAGVIGSLVGMSTRSSPAVSQVRPWPAWKCAEHAGGSSHPRLPSSLGAVAAPPRRPPRPRASPGDSARFAGGGGKPEGQSVGSGGRGRLFG